MIAEETGGCKFGEQTKNSNEERLIDLCTLNIIIVSTTPYKHHKIYKFIREMLIRMRNP